MGDDEYVKKIDLARKTGKFEIGEQKLFDDLYEASQEGAPFASQIESLREELPICETAADLRELLRTEPDILFALIADAFPHAESVPAVEEIEEIEWGRFRVRFGLPGQTRPVEVDVDGRGKMLKPPKKWPPSPADS
jgi:hypothetical protein